MEEGGEKGPAVLVERLQAVAQVPLQVEAAPLDGGIRLGLWIAARLAEAMGGGLAAEPGPDGRGALRAWFAARPAGPPSAGKTPR